MKIVLKFLFVSLLMILISCNSGNPKNSNDQNSSGTVNNNQSIVETPKKQFTSLSGYFSLYPGVKGAGMYLYFYSSGNAEIWSCIQGDCHLAKVKYIITNNNVFINTLGKEVSMWVDEEFKIEGNQLTGNKGDIYVYNAEKIPLELTFETNKVLREINQESGSSNTNDVDEKKPIFTAENVKQPTSSSSIDKSVTSIIGKPFKISNLEVVQKDFPNVMNWNDAKEACAELGDGWRLPTKDELNILYHNKDKIGAFAGGYYWSSTENVNGNAWYQGFNLGNQYYYDKNNTLYVRAIRAF